MNFLLDATLGMLVIWAAVKLVSKLVEYRQWSLLVFGEYGECASLTHHTGAPQTHWRSDGDQFTKLQLHSWKSFPVHSSPVVLGHF